MLDYLITNAAVVDGTGSPAKIMDVGVRSGKIVMQPCEDAETVIDGSGQALAPGFIDVHGHTDLFAFVDPECGAKLRQGITTELAGQCGIGPAPTNAAHMQEYAGYYQNLGAPIYPGAEMLTSIEALMDRLDETRLGISLGLFVPQGSLRIAAMGLSRDAASDKEMDVMQGMAREAVAAGALGISTGLMYAPGLFTSPEELAKLCSTLRGTDAIYTSHIRNQGNQLIESVEETLFVAKAGDLRANISHHKADANPNSGNVRTPTATIHAAGPCHDVYPYEASSTTLIATLPPSVVKMGNAKILDSLGDNSFREELQEKIFNPTEMWDNDLLECGYDGILIFSAEKTPEAVGCTIEEYANKLNCDPFDAYCELLLRNELAAGDICFSMSLEDVEYLIADSSCMFGTDSLYVPALMTMTHPRSIGTFPKILGESVREKKLLTLEQAIHKMTGLPADFYGLKGKGLIADGMDADLVLFDAKTIGARSTYTNPLQDNIGINKVFVNGEIAASDGKTTGYRGGRVLRKGH